MGGSGALLPLTWGVVLRVSTPPLPPHHGAGGEEGGEDVDRHGHGGGCLHQPHVHGPRLWSPLLCQERLVRPALQKLHCESQNTINKTSF